MVRSKQCLKRAANRGDLTALWIVRVISLTLTAWIIMFREYQLFNEA